MNRRLIVNADDFGLSEGVNLGILAAHREGIVSSTTLMVNMPAAAAAFALARANPSLGVGIHFVLTAGRPLTEDVASLTGPDGHFLRLPALAEQADPAHVRQELEAQFSAFLDSGLRPTHIDSHHHVCGTVPAAEAAMIAIAARERLPVRHALPQRERIRQSGLKTTDHFDAGYYGRGNISAEQLVAQLAALPQGLSELMTHPAYIDHHLMRVSSYSVERVEELVAVTDPAVKQALVGHGIELVDYRIFAA